MRTVDIVPVCAFKKQRSEGGTHESKTRCIPCPCSSGTVFTYCCIYGQGGGYARAGTHEGVPPAMRCAPGGHTKYILPREGLVARLHPYYDSVVVHALEFPLVGFHVLEHDANFVAKGKLLQAVPIALPGMRLWA